MLKSRGISFEETVILFKASVFLSIVRGGSVFASISLFELVYGSCSKTSWFSNTCSFSPRRFFLFLNRHYVFFSLSSLLNLTVFPKRSSVCVPYEKRKAQFGNGV